MKTIFITESQHKMLKESVFGQTQVDCVFGNEASSLSPLLSLKNEERLISKRKDEVHEVIKNLFGNSTPCTTVEMKDTLSKLISECVKKESKIKEFLEKLCYDSVIELFNCPEGVVKLSCDLVNKIDSSNISIHINPIEGMIEFDDSTELNEAEKEIEKRMFLNTLIIGASIVLTKTILKNKKHEINKLDSTLYNIYRKILWLNEYYMFHENVEVTDNTPNQGGGVDVKLGTDKKQTVINSKALCLPILMFETIKGFFELFISHGLPSDRNITEYILTQSDSLKYQQYSIVVGPVLWNKIMTVLYNDGTDTEMLPHLLTEISSIETDNFNDIMKEIVLSTTLGKKYIEDILFNINNKIDYDDFEKRINDKRNEKNLINDDEYMSEDELVDDLF
jgi:hypothetical protein